jgi:DNA-3-methyladenine glycosylase II
MIQPRFEAAEKYLAKADPAMKKLIKLHGHCTIQPHADAFFVLCDSIISQQLSVKAAGTIFKRFCALFPDDKPMPELLAVVPAESVRSVGCSNAKVRYLQDLGAKFLDCTIQPHAFATMDDEAIIATLLQVKGIGRWTAEMYLIFSLARPDVMAVDDLGLRKGMMLLKGLPGLPKRSEMLFLSDLWKPYRSVASWYLWRSLENEPAIAKI